MPFMRPSVLFIIIILLKSFASSAQKDTFTVRTNFTNQGEQEEYWAEKFFYENYKTEIHQKYKGQIREINKTTLVFDSSVVMLLNDRNNLFTIFKMGLLFPKLFSNTQDTVRIDALEELKNMKIPPTKKRFKLWFYGNGQFNPNVYLFELTNEMVRGNTSLETFLQNATLTYFKRGWRII
jgi:hypothetical protein